MLCCVQQARPRQRYSTCRTLQAHLAFPLWTLLPWLAMVPGGYVSSKGLYVCVCGLLPTHFLQRN